jgi:hypothetical protein
MEERFAAEFTGLQAARGFPGFLGGEFARSIREPNIFTVTALWENAEAYAAWQARAGSADPTDPLVRLMETAVSSFEPGKPFEILQEVPAV